MPAGSVRYSASRFSCGVGQDPFKDMVTLFRGDRPLIFDVGANKGQTVKKFRKAFREPKIHSFEPSPTMFDLLRTNTASIPDVHLWDRALGSASGQMALQENDESTMTSFLPLSKFGWGSVIKQTSVAVDTVDHFCLEHQIDRIDILKSDTQGYDLEVFKGAERMFQQNRIGLVFTEIIFNDMYKNLPSMSQIYDFSDQSQFLACLLL